MALGEERGQAQTLQVEMVCLDELVPADDRYRRLDGLLDWGFVRELAAPYYAEVVGRPSIDPIVLVKLMLAGAHSTQAEHLFRRKPNTGSGQAERHRSEAGREGGDVLR